MWSRASMKHSTVRSCKLFFQTHVMIVRCFDNASNGGILFLTRWWRRQVCNTCVTFWFIIRWFRQMELRKQDTCKTRAQYYEKCKKPGSSVNQMMKIELADGDRVNTTMTMKGSFPMRSWWLLMQPLVLNRYSCGKFIEELCLILTCEIFHRELCWFQFLNETLPIGNLWHAGWGDCMHLHL